MTRRVDIMGVPVHALTLAQTVDAVSRIIEAGEPRQHMAVNAAKLVYMLHDEELRASVLGADLINADGAAIVYASRFLGRPLPERVTGVDLFNELIARAPERGWRPYFFGAKQRVLDAVVENLTARHPGLDIAGARNGYFSPDEERDIATAIRDAKPQMLFVGISSPIKEHFLARWKDYMGVPYIMGVGGTFDIVAGELSRAPKILRDNGLEWAWRTILQPKRMWRRNTIDSLRFAIRTVRCRYSGFHIPSEPMLGPLQAPHLPTRDAAKRRALRLVRRG